jgi:hypothetical protein
MEIREELICQGVNNVLSESAEGLTDVRFLNSIVKNITDIIDDPSTLNDLPKSVVYNYISKTPDSKVYTIPKWFEEINISADMVKPDNIQNIHWDLFYDHRRIFNGERFVHHGLIANYISKRYKWSGIATRIVTSMEYASVTTSYILSCWIDEDSEDFINHINIKAFGKVHGHKVRAQLYAALSKSGLLTKNQARKMRSDPSSHSSLSGLTSLIVNSDLYPNYDELLTQFMDTRYEDVANELAKSSPIHMISFLLGSEFYWAKSVAEERFNKHFEGLSNE